MSITTVPVRLDGRARRQNRRRAQDKLVPTMIDACRRGLVLAEQIGKDHPNALEFAMWGMKVEALLKRIEG